MKEVGDSTKPLASASKSDHPSKDIYVDREQFTVNTAPSATKSKTVPSRNLCASTERKYSMNPFANVCEWKKLAFKSTNASMVTNLISTNVFALQQKMNKNANKFS